MPKKATKKKKKNVRSRRVWIAWSLLALVAVTVVLLGVMYIEASVIHIERDEVYLTDLPEAFDGVTVLFLSDLHMDSVRTPARTVALIDQLKALEPDILILGGDYASTGLNEMLFGMGDANKLEAAAENRRESVVRLVQTLDGFSAPMGKYAVRGEADENLVGLNEVFRLGEVDLLQNDARRIWRGGESIVIAGIDDWKTGAQDLASLARSVAAAELVILVTHNPDALPAINNQPTSDGGHMADLVLSSHTHGGQVLLLGKAMYEPSIYPGRYRSGWFSESGVTMLVSHGVGTSLVPFRLGARAEVHLIILRRAEKANFS